MQKRKCSLEMFCFIDSAKYNMADPNIGAYFLTATEFLNI